MSWRNTERTGQRRLTKLSGIARRIEGVRHLDCDLFQYCPRCKHPQAFMEVKRVLVSDREWEQMRFHAGFWGCMALLIIEPDVGNFGVKVFDGKEISEVEWGDEDLITGVLERARDEHRCK